MIDLTDAIISQVAYHRVSNEENSFLNNKLYEFNAEGEQDIFKNIFLKPFLNQVTTYEFFHEVEIGLNPLYKLSKDIREDEDFLSKTQSIKQYLESVSTHPNIKDGDLFIVKYEDIQYNNKFYEALGIYKVENKENFIETTSDDTENDFVFKQGITSRKLDKACLILFSENPYTVFIIDTANIDAEYWKNDFIGVRLKNDNVNNTSHFLQIAKTFVVKQLPEDFEVDKPRQIDMLNKSIEFFKKNDMFDKDEFEKEIFGDKEVISSFKSFYDDYKENNNVEIQDNFEISNQAVKKQARIFKSVLKLDKNFHIYIHGDRELIEKGTDPDGRKFYKIYYTAEE